jgi:hypothetical protein
LQKERLHKSDQPDYKLTPATAPHETIKCADFSTIKEDSLSTKTSRLNAKRKNFPCPICSVALATSKQLLTHMESFHSHYLKPLCQICSIHFDSLKAYTQHMLGHQQTEILPKPVNENTSYADKQVLRELVDRLETLNWCKCYTCLMYCRKFFMHLTDAHGNNEIRPEDNTILTVVINDDDEVDKQELEIPIFDPAVKEGDCAAPRQLMLKVKKVGNSRIYGCPLCSKEFKYPAIVEHIRSHSDGVDPAAMAQDAIIIDSDEDDQEIDESPAQSNIITDEELDELTTFLVADNKSGSDQQKDKSITASIDTIAIESDDSDEEISVSMPPGLADGDTFKLIKVAEPKKRPLPSKESKTLILDGDKPKVHFQAKKVGQKTIYTCTICGLELADSKEIAAHFSVHSDKTIEHDTEKPTKDTDGKIVEYQCSLCGTIKNTRAGALHCLKWHKENGWYDVTEDDNNSHTGVQQIYKCKLCKDKDAINLTFKKQQQSLRHIQEKHFYYLSRDQIKKLVVVKKRVVVNTDGSVNEVKGEFRYNISNCITVGYQCECKQIFSSKSLAERCMNIHSGIRRYVCTEKLKIANGE